MRKLIKLIAEVWFYSVGIMLLFLFVLEPVDQVGLKDIIRACIPIGYSTYWFMTDYILLMLMTPILNLVISRIDQEFHRNMIFLFTVLWFLIPSFTLAYYDCSNLGCFVVLYFIAGYIRKHVSMAGNNASRHFIFAIALYCIVILSNISLIFLGHCMKIERFMDQSGHFAALNSPFILLISVELLVGFLKMKPYRNIRINRIASATLGVYLIHDHPLFRPYLWQKILKNPEMYSSNLLVIHALLSIAGVYIICTLFDLLRQKTVERFFMMLMDHYYEKVKKNALFVLNSLKSTGKGIINWYYGR